MSYNQVKGWFSLSRKEQWFIAGILALFLLGLAARHLHLRRQHPDPVRVDRPGPAEMR